MLLMLAAAALADDVFVQFYGPDIPGESQDLTYRNWHEVDSLSLGASRGASFDAAGNRVLDAPRQGEITFTTHVDAASAPLAGAALAGGPFDSVVVEVRRSGASLPVLHYTLEGAVATSYEVRQDGGDVPREVLTLFPQLVLTQIWEFTAQGARREPPIETCWDAFVGAGPECPVH